MQSRKTEFEERGIRIVAISAAHTPEELARHASENGIDFFLLADTELTAADAYGLRHEGGNPFGGDIARPGMFWIDGDGRIIDREFTENWRVREGVGEVLERFE